MNRVPKRGSDCAGSLSTPRRQLTLRPAAALLQVILGTAPELPSLAAAAVLAAAFPRAASPPSARQSGLVYGASGSTGFGSPRSLGLDPATPASRAASLPQSPSTAHSAQTVQHSGLSGASAGGQLRSGSLGGDRPTVMSRLGTQSRGMWDIPFSELQLRRKVGAGAFGAASCAALDG